MLRSIKLSPPIQWLSMAPNAIKDGRRQSAVKKVHLAKLKGTHKDEAKVHKVNKKLLQAQAEDSCSEEVDHVIQDGHEKEHEEEQQEEQEGNASNMRPLRRTRPKCLESHITTFGSHCPRHPGLCK